MHVPVPLRNGLGRSRKTPIPLPDGTTAFYLTRPASHHYLRTDADSLWGIAPDLGAPAAETLTPPVGGLRSQSAPWPGAGHQ
jgi:hypothetical protein